MNKNKKIKDLVILLFFILTSQFCYADEGEEHALPVKIEELCLYKVTENNIEIADFGKGNYGISFATLSGCSEPFFNITDSNLLPLDDSIQQDVRSSLLAEMDDGNKLFAHIVYSGVIDRGKLKDSYYSIDFGKEGREFCEVIEGNMPEIQVDLFDEEDGKKHLVIKNISSKGIVITKIKELNPEGMKKIINIESKADAAINISAGHTDIVVLKPENICTFANEKKEEQLYLFNMEYKIDGVLSENRFKIKLKCSCDWELERLQKEKGSLQKTNAELSTKNSELSTKVQTCKIQFLNIGNQLASEKMRCEAKTRVYDAK